MNIRHFEIASSRKTLLAMTIHDFFSKLLESRNGHGPRSDSTEWFDPEWLTIEGLTEVPTKAVGLRYA